ncbi:unnamed protein product [Chironomus riparius]|uniref:Ionotropic receptor n=1 Tax=Chironomus riparius TaxID=315576 RepID=A0A9N9WYD5_9DIPT|nr:unnamed protein product [Chironomus riparius]
MRLTKVFIAFYFICAAQSQMSKFSALKNQETEVISAFIATICEDFFIQKSINFDIIVFGSPTERINDITSGFVKHLADQFPIKYSSSRNFEANIEKSTIILMHNRRAFQKYQKNLNLDPEIIYNLKIFIYIDEFYLPEAGLDKDLKKLHPFEHFILNTNQVLYLSTLVINCDENYLGIIYSYDKKMKTFIKKVKNYSNYNLQGCPLLIFSNIGPLIYFEDYNKRITNTGEPEGYMIDIFNILAKIYDFKPIYQVKTALVNVEFDLFKHDFIDFEVCELTEQTSYMTSSIHQRTAVLVTKKATTYKSLLLDCPFNFHTWVAVITSLFVAFIVIFYMNLRLGVVRIRPRKELTRSALNVFQIVFGCPQKKLPRANFGRLFIILFIGLCLVLRICYWSQLVGFMTIRVDKMEPRTVEDLIVKNYTIYGCGEDQKPKSEEWNDIRFIKDCEYTTTFVCNTLKYSDENVLFLVKKDEVPIIQRLCSVQITKIEGLDLPMITYTLSMTKFNFIYEHFRNIIDKLFPAGITQYLLEQHIMNHSGRYEEVDKDLYKGLKLRDFKCEELELETIFVFSPQKCDRQQTKLFNLFTKSSLTWGTTLKSIQKFGNLFGCPIMFQNLFHSKFLYFNDNDRFRCSGFMIDMAEILTKIVNFVLICDQQMIEDIQNDFISQGDLNDNDDKRSLTSHLVDNSVILAIKKPDILNSVLLLSTFNFHTWIAVITSLFVAFVVIFYMNLRLGIVRIRPRKELTRPALNVLQIVFGCPEKKLPRANFGRFLIILFLGLCLVLRIFYWSQLVKLKAIRGDKLGPETVKDLVEGNYTIYSCYPPFSKDKIQLDSVQIVDQCEESTKFFCDTLKNSDKNVGFLILVEKFPLYQAACDDFIILKKFEINRPMISMHTSSYSVIYETLNEILWKLTPAGIPQYLLAHHSSIFVNKIEPQKSNVNAPEYPESECEAT